MNDRAITPEQKRVVVERLLAVWEKAPALRLGQLMECARAKRKSHHHISDDFFYVEDEELAAILERFVEQLER